MKRQARENAENSRKSEETAAEAKAAQDTTNSENLPECEPQPAEESAGQAEGKAEEQSDNAAPEKDAADAAAKELADTKDRYMRLLAEYDNFRKRTQKEREALYTDAVSDVSKEWLAVIDNVERALSFSDKSAEDNTDKISEGMEKIYKQALDVMAKLGVKEIPCETGTAFNPNFHSAVAHIEDDSLGEQTVAQVFLKGYLIGERVIRHTLVQVAN